MRALVPAALLLLAASPAGEQDPATPPPGLACLPRWYPVKVVSRNGIWSMQLPDGRVLPYDDGKPKTFEEMLRSPDMQDTYIIPYRTGPIVPVIDENDDPGHIRFEPLLEATYGRSASEVDLVWLNFLGHHVRVHRRVKEPFQRVAARLKKALAADRRLGPFLSELGGTWIWRKIADTERQSAHSYGVAMDINARRSHYWNWIRPKLPVHWQNAIPQAIVDAFEAEGFIWGGRWFHYDTMHFEYRPELLDPGCRPPLTPAGPVPP